MSHFSGKMLLLLQCVISAEKCCFRQKLSFWPQNVVSDKKFHFDKNFILAQKCRFDKKILFGQKKCHFGEELQRSMFMLVCLCFRKQNTRKFRGFRQTWHRWTDGPTKGQTRL